MPTCVFYIYSYFVHGNKKLRVPGKFIMVIKNEKALPKLSIIIKSYL